MTTATELEEATSTACIRKIVAHVAPFHERYVDPDLAMVIACDLEGLDTFLLMALADALEA